MLFLIKTVISCDNSKLYNQWFINVISFMLYNKSKRCYIIIAIDFILIKQINKLLRAIIKIIFIGSLVNKLYLNLVTQ